MAVAKSDLKNLSLREFMIIGFTLVFGMGYGYYEFEYTAQNNKLKKITADMIQVKSSLSAFQSILIDPGKVKKTKAQIVLIEKDISKLEQEIDKAKGRLKGQDAEILNDLQNEADFFGVFLKSMRTKEKFINRSGMRLKEVSLIMEMESEYNALKSFIASLGSFPAVLDIESLETRRNEKILPKVESRLHLKVLVL
jgi:Tfp pilus assembly protein PilO